MNEEKAVGAELSWDSDKNLEDFRVIRRNLFDEKQLSRARAVFYLIERAKMAENRESEKDAQLARQDALLEEAKAAIDALLKGHKIMRGDYQGRIPERIFDAAEQMADLILPRLTTRNHSEGETGGLCSWHQIDDPDFGIWKSSCGVEYQFTNDGPRENHHKYCHHCGKPIRLISESFDQRNPHPPSGVIEDGNNSEEKS